MKVRYLGPDEEFHLQHGKVYEVEGTEEVNGYLYYGVIDDMEISYLYESEDFEVVEE